MDLLLLDEALGREIGVRLLAEVRTTEPGLPSVVVSGHADLEMALKAMRVLRQKCVRRHVRYAGTDNRSECLALGEARSSAPLCGKL